MKVKDLKEILATIPEDTLIVISKDSEGNGFSPLADISVESYRPETTWSGHLLETLYGTISDPHAFAAVCLWPIN